MKIHTGFRSSWFCYRSGFGPTLLHSCYLLFIHLADVIQSDLEQIWMTLIRCPAGQGLASCSGRPTGGR